MIRLIIKLLILFLIITIIITGILFFLPCKNEYLHAIHEKEKIIVSTDQPRIIFAGGMCLANAIDSKMIQGKTGYNVVNMALHHGLGHAFIINELKPFIKENDIVILIPEYQMSNEYYIYGNSLVLSLTATLYPKSLSYYEMGHVLNILNNISKLLRFRIKYAVNSINHKDNKQLFNQYGDFRGNLTSNNKEIFDQYLVYLYDYRSFNIDNKTITIINDFILFCKQKKIKVYISFPPYNIDNNKKEDFTHYVSSFYKNRLNAINLELIGLPQDFLYEKKFFSQEQYIVNQKGRNIYTQDLIKKIIKHNVLNNKK